PAGAFPGMVVWAGGTIFSRSGGTLTNTGFMRIAQTGVFSILLEAPLNNFGTITQTGGRLFIGASGVLNNHGIYDLQTDNPSINGGGFNNENDGTFRKSLNTGLAQPTGAFNNHGGTTYVQRGTLRLRSTPRTHTRGTLYTPD